MAGRITIEKRGAIGFLIFDYPERRNAITLAMWQQIPEAAQQLAADDDVRVVILRGAGEQAFVAGADISEFERNRTADNVDAYERDNARAFAALAALHKPVIAMVHGFCVGGGVAIALCADLRYAASDAVFGVPAAKLGLGYAMAGIETLTQIVGYSNAKEIFFTARRFPAQRALQMGLLNGVFDKPQLEQEVLAVAEEIAKNAPLTLRAVKLCVADLQREPEARQPQVTGQAIQQCYASADYREGVAAFLEKRPPRFTGR